MTVTVGYTYRDVLSPVHSVVNKKNLYKVKFKPTTIDKGYADLNNVQHPVTYEICSLLSVIYSCQNHEKKTVVRHVQDMVLCDHDDNDCSNCPFVMQQALINNANAINNNNRGYNIR